jgi:hypothetical protein
MTAINDIGKSASFDIVVVTIPENMLPLGSSTPCSVLLSFQKF